MYAYSWIPLVLALGMSSLLGFSAPETGPTGSTITSVALEPNARQTIFLLTLRIIGIKQSYLYYLTNISENQYVLPEEKEELEQKLLSFEETRSIALESDGPIEQCRGVLIELQNFRSKHPELLEQDKILEKDLQNAQDMCTRLTESVQRHVVKLNTAIQSGKAKYASLNNGGGGENAKDVCREVGICEQTFYAWKRKWPVCVGSN